LSIVSLLLLLPLRVLSQDLQWTQRMPVPPLDATLVDLVYAHDRIFAADVAWGIWSSVDGLRWERHAVPAAFGPHIRFENGRFFASNSTSVDGVEWVVRKPAEGYKAAFDSRNVTWLGDRYFAASYDLAARKIVFATSIDGINWQTRLGEVDFQPGAIAVGGKTIVIQGQQSDGRAAALVSSDGEQWSAYVIHPEPSFKNLAYGNGMFVAVGYDSRQISGGGAIYWSPDGKSWTGFNLDGLWLEKIRFAGGQFVSVGGNGSHIITTSTDGVIWTRQTTGLESGQTRGPYLTAVTSYPRGFIVAGAEGTLISSTEGKSWRRLDPGPGGVRDGIFARGEFWFPLRSEMLASSDGTVWRRHPIADFPEQGASLFGLTYTGTSFIGIRWPRPGLFRSLDGRVWTPVVEGRSYHAIASGNGILIAIESRRIARSFDDGVNWEILDTGIDKSFRRITYGNRVFVAVTDEGGTFTSQDGSNWTSNSVSLYEAVFFKGRFYTLAAGGLGVSEDGTTWKIEPIRWPDGKPSGYFGPSAGANELIIAANYGDQGALLLSSDGVTWRRSTPAPIKFENPIVCQGTGVILVSELATGAPYSAFSTNRLFSATSGAQARLRNFSSLGNIGPEALTLGFAAIGGDGARVLMRSTGPGLAAFGLSNIVQGLSMRAFDPRGAVVDANSSVVLPMGTTETAMAAAARVSAFPQTSGDPSLYLRLRAGAYTVQSVAEGGSTGQALAEIYSAEPSGNGAGLTNLSARGRIRTGAARLIVGFVVDGVGPATVLLRAIGPGLRKFGVANVAADPSLAIFNAAGASIGENNDWSSGADDAAIRYHAIRSGAFPLDDDSRDAAILLSLAPGVYTAHITDRNSGGGEVLFELYEVP